MKIADCKQGSPEWWALKKGRIGGKRFSQVISGAKNRLIYTLLDERLSEFLLPDDYVDDEMQFGIDNEPVAAKLYSEMTGIEFIEVGAILSKENDIHMASPDRINIKRGIVVEIKCTTNGDIHLQRFFEGIESANLPQVKNYFAVDDDVQEVHWVSYCPFRPEKPLFAIILKREQFAAEIPGWRNKVRSIQDNLILLEQKFIF